MCDFVHLKTAPNQHFCSDTNEGEQTGDVENSVANTNGIMLMWPGAASTRTNHCGNGDGIQILSVRTDGDS